MAKIFITGSTDGLGKLAAKSLIEQGHNVVLHARKEKRKSDVLKEVSGAENVLTGDLSSIEETINLAEQVNKAGSFDAVIHNAGINKASGKDIAVVNTLAPYILTCLINKPKRLVYLSSGMHMSGSAKIESLKKDMSRITYSDSKLHVLMLAKAVARKWNDVYSNAVDPGWVPTKMGGRGAPDDLQKGYETQVWLAASDDDKAKVTGKYFFHKNEKSCNPEANKNELQDKFLDICKEITGISFPEL